MKINLAYPLIVPDSPRMQVQITDAGRSGSGLNETRDCVVRALAIAAGVTYESAHAACKQAGRSNRRGFKLAKGIRNGKLPQFKFTRIGRSPKTVSRFLAEHPEGRYLARISKHAFAIVDGVINDSEPRRDRERITHAWTVAVV